ncbi:uncharacterized protein V6R79_014215 [Siganus canaliculatus]
MGVPTVLYVSVKCTEVWFMVCFKLPTVVVTKEQLHISFVFSFLKLYDFHSRQQQISGRGTAQIAEEKGFIIHTELPLFSVKRSDSSKLIKKTPLTKAEKIKTWLTIRLFAGRCSGLSRLSAELRCSGKFY